MRHVYFVAYIVITPDNKVESYGDAIMDITVESYRTLNDDIRKQVMKQYYGKKIVLTSLNRVSDG
jgi:hypothetical protein